MKKILLLMILCLSLVGCSSKTDYGIFTKEGYGMLTEEDRARIEKEYMDTIKSIEYMNDGDYYEAALAIPINSIEKATANYATISYKLDDVLYPLWDNECPIDDVWIKYIEAKEDIKEYFTEETIEGLTVDVEVLNSMKEYMME